MELAAYEKALTNKQFQLDGYSIVEERWAKCRKEIMPMWAGEHADETVAPEDAQLKVNPSQKSLLKLDKSRTLYVLTVRHEQTLIGYALTIFLPDFSCSHLLIGHVMIHYITPTFRGKGLARKLFDTIELEARKRGANAVLAGNKAHLPHGGFFWHMSYHPYGTTYIKWLEP